MSTYFVKVKRTISKYKTFEVEAESQESAEDQVREILDAGVPDDDFVDDGNEDEIIEESE